MSESGLPRRRARVRAEQDHLLGVYLVDDDLNHPFQNRVVNPCHGTALPPPRSA